MTDTFTFGDGDEDKDVGEPDWLFRSENTKSIFPVGFREAWEVQSKTDGFLKTRKDRTKSEHTKQIFSIRYSIAR